MKLVTFLQITLLIFIIINISYVRAETPAYSILVMPLSSTRFNPGDKVELKIYITGNGIVEDNKLAVNIPREIVFNKTVKVTDFRTKCDEHDNCQFFWEPNRSIEYGPRFLISFTDLMFNLVSPEDFRRVSEEGMTVNEIYYAPLNIEFIIDNNTSRGDHEIEFFFFYKFNDTWYKDEKTLKIYVRSIYEQYQLLISIVSIIIALLTGYGIGSKKIQSLLKKL